MISHFVRNVTPVLFLIFMQEDTSAHSLPAQSYPAKTAKRLSIEEKIDRYVDKLPDPFSGTILLAIGDDILLNKGYGWANKSFSIPNSAETKYELASETKYFTIFLVFKLVELGLLELNATIDTYLPHYPEAKASMITIRHLLLNQSGIPFHLNIPGFLGFHDRIYHTPRELLGLFCNEDLVHKPGERETYTSSGYWLLAIIMETVTGKSFAELLNRYIFLPLKMKDTFVENNITVYENLAVGYRKGLKGYVRGLKEVQSNNLGAGDMISTTGDLYRFQKALSLDNNLVLSAETKRRLFEEKITIQEIPYNKGKNRLRIIGIYEGGNYGFQARMTRLLDQDACYIVLSNVHNDRATNELFYHFLQDTLCEELDIPVRCYSEMGPTSPIQTPASVSEKQLRLYEGLYKTDNDTFVQVFVENGRLYYRTYESNFYGRKNTIGGELIPLSEGTFVDRNGWTYRYFMFVIPSDLPTEGPHASLKKLFTDIPDSDRHQLIMVKYGAPIRAMRWKGDEIKESSFAEYQGLYYSVELQETFDLTVSNDQLKALSFVGSDEVKMVPLKEDLFICDKGFIVFHHYEDGSVRDFWLMNEKVDHVYGSLVIKK